MNTWGMKVYMGKLIGPGGDRARRIYGEHMWCIRIYIYICILEYIYIYMERERERERCEYAQNEYVFHTTNSRCITNYFMRCVFTNDAPKLGKTYLFPAAYWVKVTNTPQMTKMLTMETQRRTAPLMICLLITLLPLRLSSMRYELN